MIRVLIVDDSPVIRTYLRFLLNSDPDVQVIGTANDGEEAVKFAATGRPDVITMDINMPNMNGFEATRRIMETHPVPIVIVSASWDPEEVAKTFQAMEAGAVAVLEKPRGMGHPGAEDTTKQLIRTVKLMSEVKVVRRWPQGERARAESPVSEQVGLQRPAGPIRLVAIGASTGGPPALQTILSGLSPDAGVPVMIVQHITPGFSQGFADWISQSTPWSASVANQGELIEPGKAYVAPDGAHMKVSAGGRISLTQDQPEHGLRPSVSYFFRSVADAFGQNAIGVLLTGMGRDGAEELKLMKLRGAATIAQDKESSVVHGMPGEAIKLGGATYVLPPHQIASALGTLIGSSSGLVGGSHPHVKTDRDELTGRDLGR